MIVICNSWWPIFLLIFNDQYILTALLDLHLDGYNVYSYSHWCSVYHGRDRVRRITFSPLGKLTMNSTWDLSATPEICKGENPITTLKGMATKNRRYHIKRCGNEATYKR